MTIRLCLTITLLLMFIGCTNDQKVSDQQIDKTAEDVKDGLDKFTNQAKKFLEEGRMDKLKEVVDEVAEKGKSMSDDTEIWNAKFEKLKNDPEVQELLKDLEGDGKDILEHMKQFEKEIEGNKQLKAQLEGIKTNEELQVFLENYDGEGKEILQKFERSLSDLKSNQVLKEKWKSIEEDEEIKALLKKYETDGKEILEKLEKVFEGLETK